MISEVFNYLGYLNNSKFFAGLVMIMLNIGSKYVTIELSKSQEAYLKNSYGDQYYQRYMKETYGDQKQNINTNSYTLFGDRTFSSVLLENKN